MGSDAIIALTVFGISMLIFVGVTALITYFVTRPEDDSWRDHE